MTRPKRTMLVLKSITRRDQRNSLLQGSLTSKERSTRRSSSRSIWSADGSSLKIQHITRNSFRSRNTLHCPSNWRKQEGVIKRSCPSWSIRSATNSSWRSSKSQGGPHHPALEKYAASALESRKTKETRIRGYTELYSQVLLKKAFFFTFVSWLQLLISVHEICREQ